MPRFAHVPLILGADKKRLSKRHGATSVMEYERQGYFSAAMVNFLALLGWAPGDDRELLSKAELIEAFSLEAISGGNAVFNTEKLDWMNGQYIGRMSPDELAAALRPQTGGGRPGRRAPRARSGAFGRLLELLRPRAKRLTDFVEQAQPLLMDEVDYTPEAVEKHLSEPGAGQPRRGAPSMRWRATEPFDEAALEATVRDTAAALGIKAGAAHPRHACGRHRPDDQPRNLRGAGAARARATALARLDRLHRFLLARA